MAASRQVGALALCVATSALARPAAAQTPPMPPPMPAPAMVAAPPPSSLMVGNQYYEGDLDGFRTYLDTLQATDPKLYLALNPKLTSLEEQRTLGTVVMWSGIVVGAGVVVWGVSKAAGGLDLTECTKLPPLSAERSRCEDEKTDEWESESNQGLMFIGIGVGVAVVGFVSGLAIKPGRASFMELINEHNRALPSNPMRLQLGFDPARRRAHAGLRLDFDLTQLL